MTGSGNRKLIRALLAAVLLVPGAQGFCQTSGDVADLLSRIRESQNEYQRREQDRQLQEQLKADQRAAATQLTAKWRSVTKEERAMTSEPRAPGAAAVYLYTEYKRDDVLSREFVYRQIKILTEQGRDLANISINYDKDRDPLLRVEARVIQPDGKTVAFKGTIHDTPLTSGRQMSWRARSFALPDVRVGSIIEYRYWREMRDPDPMKWMLNQALFTRHARYQLQPVLGAFPAWSYSRAPPAGIEGPKLKSDGVLQMEVHNMPPLVVEDYMPPLENAVLSVDFTHGGAVAALPPATYWRAYGEYQWQGIEAFLGDPAQAVQHLAGILGNEDGVEQKVRKIHEHVRRLGNLDIPGLMDEKTQQQCSRERKSALEVGKDGCGSTGELQLYFMALVRAAGVPAVPVLVASRAERFFLPDAKNASHIDDLLIAVTIDRREVLLNPSVPFIPYGGLFWFQTGVPGFRLAASGGEWFTTPMPTPADAVTRRKARLVLTEDGALEGTVVVRHAGHAATARVMQLYLADDQTRRSALEQDLRRTLAMPADVTVVRQPGWQDNNGILEIEYQVKVRDWALTSGERLMVGIGLFGGEQIGKFTAPTREQPMYFEFPFATEDEVEIVLPAGYRLEIAPARQVSPDAALRYVTAVKSIEGGVSIRRTLSHNLLLALPNQYPRVKQFYELVRSGDQEQVILAR